MRIPYAVLPSADRDLGLQADYLVEEASVEIALLFLGAANKTFSRLAVHPNMGRRLSLGPAFQSIRAFPVTGFEIIRVLHGARDLDALFGKEPFDGPEL